MGIISEHLSIITFFYVITKIIILGLGVLLSLINFAYDRDETIAQHITNFYRTYSSLVLGGIEEVKIVILRIFSIVCFSSQSSLTKMPKGLLNDQTVSVGHHCYRETILASE